MTQNITWWFFFTDPMFSAAPGTKSTEHCPPIWKHLPARGSVTQNQCIGLKGWKTRSFWCRYIHHVPTTSQVHLLFNNFSSTSTKQQITPSRPPGTGDLFVPRLPHVGQEEPGVHFAEDDVADWDHPESTCPSEGGVQALKVEKTISLVWDLIYGFSPLLSGWCRPFFTP